MTFDSGSVAFACACRLGKEFLSSVVSLVTLFWPLFEKVGKGRKREVKRLRIQNMNMIAVGCTVLFTFLNQGSMQLHFLLVLNILY